LKRWASAGIPDGRARASCVRAEDIRRALPDIGEDRPIDVLVNCARYLGRETSFEHHGPSDWRRIVAAQRNCTVTGCRPGTPS
jgi:hypothetical protein